MNELQTILAETCTRLFTDHATTAVLEAAEKGEWPAAFWQALEENGLTLPQVPEARGGAGGSWNDAFLVLMAAGRFAAPVPLAETMLAGAILAEAGLDAPLGPMTVAPVHIDEGLTLARQGSGWALRSRATRSPGPARRWWRRLPCAAGSGSSRCGRAARWCARRRWRAASSSCSPSR